MRTLINDVAIDTSDNNHWTVSLNGTEMHFKYNSDARFVFNLLNEIQERLLYFDKFLRANRRLLDKASALQRSLEDGH